MPIGIWPSQRIRRAIAERAITAKIAVTENQIQPASLDLRLGDIAYRVPASFLPGEHRSVAERLAMLSTHELDLSRPTVLERGCVHIIPLMERLALPSTVEARANPKSSTGRLDIFVRIIADRACAFDEIPPGYAGPLYAEVVPRSFPVIASAGATLAQIRFRARAYNDQITRTVPVAVDLDPTDKPNGIVGYRARKTSGLVDLAKPGAHRIADFWDPIVVDPHRREIVLDPEEFYILASHEPVSAGPGEAAEMIAYDTALAEARLHQAGYVDPSFHGKLVLEVRAHDVPFLLMHRQKVGTLVYEKMAETPDTLYGAQLGSNYQGQQLKLSKHFAP